MVTERDGLIVDGQIPRRHRPSLLWPCLWGFLGLSIMVTIAAFSVKAVTIARAKRAAAASDTDRNTSDSSKASKPPDPFALGQMEQLNILAKTPHLGCESTVILIRHCEKEGPELDASEQHCSYLGLERAHFLATLFGTRWPIPSQLYALSPTRSGHLNMRELETLQPLAQKVNVSIQNKYTRLDSTKLATNVFSRMGDQCGQVTVISWEHSALPDLSKALGCSSCPDAYPNDTFDQVWQLKYVYAPHQQRRNLKKKSEDKKQSPQGRWVLFSSVTEQRFDPLEFSFQSGDYPDGGQDISGRWDLVGMSVPTNDDEM